MATNIAASNALPLPVQQVAAAQQLGAFKKVYTASVVRTIIGSCVFLMATAFFGVGGLLPAGLELTTRVVLVVFGVLSLAVALYLGYSGIQVAHQQIYLFEQGMVIERGKQVQAFSWHQVSEVWQSITRNYRNGRYTGTTYVYTLRRVDGYQIKLDNLTKDIAELGPVVAQAITRELVPRALQAIRGGQILTFASLSLTQRGIANKREMLPWSQIQGVNVHQGRATIKKIGTSRVFWTERVAKIPNFHVFTVIADEMLRQAGTGQSSMPRSNQPPH